MAEKKHYEDHRKRLKEKFTTAPELLHDVELLKLFLTYVIPRKDVKPQAKEILVKAKHSLANIFESDLLAVKGIGSESAIFFNVLHEFINRMDYQKVQNKPVNMNSSAEIYQFLRHKIGYSNKEAFAILFLDSKNRLKSYKIVRVGTIMNVVINPRDIIEEAILNNAVSVIIAHNHPSGDARPSDSDIAITRKAMEVLKHTGIRLLDHMIVAYHEYHSMQNAGDIEF